MKILIVDIYYSDFLNSFYKKYSEIKRDSYNNHKDKILAECFGTSDFYSKNLKKVGVDAEDIISNAEILQKKWAKENKIKYKKNYFSKIPKLRNWFKSDWEDIILAAQIKAYNPDVIYSQKLGLPSKKVIEMSGIKPKLIVGQVACPIDFDKEKLGYYDLILTSFPHFVEKFKNIGINSEYFKIGFEESVLSKLKKEETQHDAVFVGGFSRHHNKVIDLFEYLAKNTSIDFWGYGAGKLPLNSPIKSRHHGEAWGIDMYNILYNSKISVNRHIDAAENFANNMRLYESTGVGTLLITEHKDNIEGLFEVNREIVTYHSNEELLEKINYYLEHEDERTRIAEAGQKRTLRDHTYAVRMRELKEILERYLTK